MPSRVGAWMYHSAIPITPMVPTIVKIANWIRTKRVSIYEPPSVGWLVVGVAPGTGAPWSAAGAADGGGPGNAGAVGGGAFCASGPSIVMPAINGETGGGATDGGASADCALTGAGGAFGGGTPGCQGGGHNPIRSGSPTGPGPTTPPGAPGGAPYLNCRYSGSPGPGTASAPSRPQWVPSRMLLRSPELVKS